jgi:hypothetical protein
MSSFGKKQRKRVQKERNKSEPSREEDKNENVMTSRLDDRSTKSIQEVGEPGIRIPNTGLHKNIHRFLKSKKIKGQELVDYSNVIYDFIMQVNPHIK